VIPLADVASAPRPVLVGVAGGTGSGKTTVVRSLVNALGDRDVAIIQHDSYYRDRSHLPTADRANINYDHPDALETSLLVDHLSCLLQGQVVQTPIYDFATHTRRRETNPVEPRKVIVLEGILIFVDPALRALMDIRIFVDTDDDVRFIRRLERDIMERGRTMPLVIQQYLATVKPMHLEFVEPSKRYADLIIPEGGLNRIAVDVLITKIKSLIAGASVIPSRSGAVG
jgi:uridine kinase